MHTLFEIISNTWHPMCIVLQLLCCFLSFHFLVCTNPVVRKWQRNPIVRRRWLICGRWRTIWSVIKVHNLFFVSTTVYVYCWGKFQMNKRLYFDNFFFFLLNYNDDLWQVCLASKYSLDFLRHCSDLGIHLTMRSV